MIGYIQVSSMKSLMRFRKKGKLSRWYVRPYSIDKRIDTLSYKLDLSQDLAAFHSIFHIYLTKKCIVILHLLYQMRIWGIRITYLMKRFQFRFQIANFASQEQRRLHQLRSYGGTNLLKKLTQEAKEDKKKRYLHLFESGEDADQHSNSLPSIV